MSTTPLAVPRPTNLRCEHLANPVGIDEPRPRLSWSLEHPRRGARQAAWRVIVRAGSRVAWDSGRIDGDAGAGTEYAGRALQSLTHYTWQVQWWDEEGAASEPSLPGTFVTGLLTPAEWEARWITRKSLSWFLPTMGENKEQRAQVLALYLRKEFPLRGDVRRATACVSGLGYYVLSVNGARVGDHLLDPGWTDYERLALYATYDITSALAGARAAVVGLVMGNGRHIREHGYGEPRGIVQILVECADGKREWLRTDGTWKTSHGPIRENGIYRGETYDAREEMPGWDMPGFDDAEWEPAVTCDGPALAAQSMAPIRVTEHIPAVKTWRTAAGGYVYDFGQNFSGWLRLSVQGPRCTTVRLRFAEIVLEDGTLNTGPNRSAEATDTYVLKGGSVETWEPSFTYHGFRYAEITGYPGVPGPSSVVGCFAHSDVQRGGGFSCSHELINRIHHAVVYGQRSNLMSVPTDCSQRDERLGWMGDAGLSAEEAILNFDMAAFYVKFLRDIELSQKDDGSISEVVPPYWKMYPPDPAWGAAYLQIAWFLWHYYGDPRPLRRHYPSLKRYVDFMHAQAENGILRKIRRFGDWCPPGSVSPKRTPMELTSTWYYYHDTLLLSRVAQVLGKTGDVNALAARAAAIKDAFNAEFLTDRGYRVENTSPYDAAPGQTSNALPLYLDMVPADKRALVVQRLLDAVVREQDYHVDTGIIGARFLLDALTACGHGDVAFRVAAQRSYPGWGYMIEEGATTLWERWEKLEKGGMNSHNHIMTGSIDAWFYRVLGGVTAVEPGWRLVRIAPPVFDGLDHAAVELSTIRGPLRVSWERTGKALRLVVSLPVGMEAEVDIPHLAGSAEVTESGAPLARGPGLRITSETPGVTHVRVGPGFYDFFAAGP